jgi:UDPglucose 6-dehydrogenase
VVLTSTVMPGATGGEIKAALERASGKRCGADFGLCYNPEFIALGTVIRDFYNPDFLLIGECDSHAGDVLTDIYRRTCKNSPSIARMNFVNAEITKLSVNTYITTKISYANMLARLCEHLPEADANVVTDALGLDTRIGPKYLKGAVSYGGPCFPRDNRAFAALASQVGAFSDLADATDTFNRAQIKYFASVVKRYHSGDGPLGILGLTYKPGTDVVEEAFGYLLAQELSAQGIAVLVYDPEASLSAEFKQLPLVKIATSVADCVARAKTILLATPWPEFRDLPIGSWQGRTVIDCWQSLTHLENAPGVNYVRLGYGGLSSGVREFSVAQGGPK